LPEVKAPVMPIEAADTTPTLLFVLGVGFKVGLAIGSFSNVQPAMVVWALSTGANARSVATARIEELRIFGVFMVW
jgi:hypothetical protein